MGEVELEERKLRREHCSCQQLKKGASGISTVMVEDSLRKKDSKELLIDLKIHSWYPSKMGEVEHEERKLRREHCSCQQLKGTSGKSTVMVVDSLRKKDTKELSINLKIHSWYPSKMGESRS
jgi:uracil phosphoribosyltransferase